MFKEKQLKEEIAILNDALKEKFSPSQIVEQIIGGPIEWYDWKKMDKPSQANYWNDAKSLLRNPVFQNELNAYIASIISYIAYETRNHEETMANRTLIVGMEAFRDRIEAIHNPNLEESRDELSEPI